MVDIEYRLSCAAAELVVAKSGLDLAPPECPCRRACSSKVNAIGLWSDHERCDATVSSTAFRATSEAVRKSSVSLELLMKVENRKEEKNKKQQQRVLNSQSTRVLRRRWTDCLRTLNQCSQDAIMAAGAPNPVTTTSSLASHHYFITFSRSSTQVIFAPSAASDMKKTRIDLQNVGFLGRHTSWLVQVVQ